MLESGNNILFVTNEDEIVNQLSDQLILLRNIDCILIRLYTDACETIDKDRPQSIIITCSNREEEASCIETIKLMKKHTIVPIILVLREYDEEFIQLANKAGISDCVTVEHGHSEILMRTIWSLQKNEISETHKKTNRLLEQLGIIDENTGFYTTKENQRVIENEIKYLQDNHLDAVLMAIRGNKDSGIQITKEKLDEIVKDNVRGSDIVIMNDEETYHLVLTNTNLSGAMIVWSRMIKAIGSEEPVCGCITDIANTPIDKLQLLMKNGLEIAKTTPNNFLAIDDDDNPQNSGQWLNIKDEKNSQNLKLFQQVFNKKLESTILPVLDFAQKSAKRKLKNIEIEVKKENTKIDLVITKNDKLSTLRLEHTGASFLNVYYLHDGLDSPENKKTKLELNELTEPVLKEIIDAFVLEFLSYAN